MNMENMTILKRFVGSSRMSLSSIGSFDLFTKEDKAESLLCKGSLYHVPVFTGEMGQILVKMAVAEDTTFSMLRRGILEHFSGLPDSVYLCSNRSTKEGGWSPREHHGEEFVVRTLLSLSYKEERGYGRNGLPNKYAAGNLPPLYLCDEFSLGGLNISKSLSSKTSSTDRATYKEELFMHLLTMDRLKMAELSRKSQNGKEGKDKFDPNLSALLADFDWSKDRLSLTAFIAPLTSDAERAEAIAWWEHQGLPLGGMSDIFQLTNSANLMISEAELSHVGVLLVDFLNAWGNLPYAMLTDFQKTLVDFAVMDNLGEKALKVVDFPRGFNSSTFGSDARKVKVVSSDVIALRDLAVNLVALSLLYSATFLHSSEDTSHRQIRLIMSNLYDKVFIPTSFSLNKPRAPISLAQLDFQFEWYDWLRQVVTRWYYPTLSTLFELSTATLTPNGWTFSYNEFVISQIILVQHRVEIEGESYPGYSEETMSTAPFGPVAKGETVKSCLGGDQPWTFSEDVPSIITNMRGEFANYPAKGFLLQVNLTGPSFDEPDCNIGNHPAFPTFYPTQRPTAVPTTSSPSLKPTLEPTFNPTLKPTLEQDCEQDATGAHVKAHV